LQHLEKRCFITKRKNPALFCRVVKLILLLNYFAIAFSTARSVSPRGPEVPASQFWYCRIFTPNRAAAAVCVSPARMRQARRDFEISIKIKSPSDGGRLDVDCAMVSVNNRNLRRLIVLLQMLLLQHH
jgi:hypothetical protein